MDMVSESGAITDVNEIAAALGLTPEVIKAEDEAIMATSLEDLLEAINQTEEMVSGEDIDLDVISPAMESVLNVAKGIQTVGAISRSDANSLRQMTASLEDFQDTFSNMPINSFTETPSKVNYDASMESVLGTIGRKIIEIIKAIIKWVKEKAKAFVGFFRDQRMKAKKTEEASKKVKEALKVSEKSLEEIFLSAVKPEHLNPDGETEIRTRKRGQKVDLHINSLAARLSDSPTAVSDVQRVLQNLATQSQALLNGNDAGLPALANQLDKVLFDDPTDYAHTNKGEPGVYGLDYLAAIVARLRSTASDVDVISTETPEAELNKRLSVFDSSKLVALASTMVGPLTTTSNTAAKQLAEVEKEIGEYAKQNIRLANEDPLYVKARRCKAVVQGIDDINAAYGYVMKAWTDTVVLGAKVAKDPAYGVAA